MKRRATSRAIQSLRNSAAQGDRATREIDRFESLAGDLFAAMAQVPADAVDREIETWLGKICLVLDLDRSTIYERDAPGKPVRASHTWARADIPPFPRKYDPERFFEKATAFVLAGNQFTFSHPSEIPFELGDLKLFVNRYGPKASAAIPMRAGDQVIGAASFGKFRSPKSWSSELLGQLGLVVRIFSSAIERKQAEAAARLARSELALAQRRSMMGELIASLAHELNQPLAAILSNLGGLERLLSKGNPKPAMAVRAVKDAIEDAKRAGEIVRRVRAIFKGQETHKEALDIGELVNEVLRLMSSEAALREIHVEIEVSHSIPPVVGDRILLQQCVLNLLGNAFDSITDAMSKQRRVTIGIAPETPGWIAITVCDTGAGIQLSVADRLFEPFVTTKSNGMGLGLLVTRSIIEDHGGKVWSTSNTQAGATFTFTLPVAEKRRANRSEPNRRKR